MITFKMAYRNVWRQKRRTLLTVLTMMGGFVLASMAVALSDGAYNFVINLFTSTRLGHIQIHGRGYLDKPTLYNTISDYETIGREVDSVAGVVSWAPRIYSAGLASVGERSAGVRISGIDPVRETETTSFDKKMIKGRMFSDSDTLETILGQGLADALKAEPGDSLVILTQGADGSIANDLYLVVGVLDSGDPLSDRTAMYLRLADAQELLVLQGRAHEMAIVIKHIHDVDRIAARISDAINQPDLVVEPWQVFAASFYNAMKADQQGTWIMILIIVLIVSVGVLNTVLMTVLERTREYGVLRAVGVRPAQVSRLVVYEVLVMAVGSVMVGLVLALALNYWLSQTGVYYGTSFTYGGVEFSRVYSEMNVRSYVIPALTVLVSAVFVSLFPAVKAARTLPAKAMRTH
jgi:ABC-type lipoprotein release transport system permease subunit